MDKMLSYFYRIRQKHPDLRKDIRNIINERKNPQDGLTIAELQAAYERRTGNMFPINCGPIAVVEFILTIPHMSVYCNTNGAFHFYSIE